MAGNEKEATAPEPARKGGGFKTIFVIFLLGLVLGSGALFGVYFFFMRHPPEDELPVVKPADSKAEEKAEAENPMEKPERGRLVTLKPMIVNLRGSQAKRFLKVTIGLETKAEEVMQELKNEDFQVQLNDLIIDKLSSLDISEIDTREGRNKLKRELSFEINELLRSGVINNLYFSQFTIH